MLLHPFHNFLTANFSNKESQISSRKVSVATKITFSLVVRCLLSSWLWKFHFQTVLLKNPQEKHLYPFLVLWNTNGNILFNQTLFSLYSTCTCETRVTLDTFQKTFYIVVYTCFFKTPPTCSCNYFPSFRLH